MNTQGPKDPVEKERDGLQFNRYVLRIREALEGLGLSAVPVFEAAGVSPAQVADPSGAISFETYCQIVRAAIRMDGGQALGLHVGRRISPLDHGIMGYAIVASSTLRRALMRAVRFWPVTAPPFTADIDLEGTTPQITLNLKQGVPADLEPYFLEEALGAFLQLGKELGSETLTRPRIDVAYAAPTYSEEYAEVLKADVNFSASHHRLYFDVDALDQPLRHANREAALMFESQCDAILRRMTGGDMLVDRIRGLVVERISDPVSFDEVADQLAMGERTLRRSLADQGTSFREIVLDVRMTGACEYLRSTSHTIDEISYLVGYANPTNFFRAFSKWSDETPSQYRKRASGP
ncbi:MAG: AraC family transcriptional regulator [Paracoccaceae bacterium]